MNVNDKIKQFIKDQNLTPSYFADEIGVQRSSISHILSGRNRPSFDIIQKIIRRFPELGYDWILEDETQPVTNVNLRSTPFIEHSSKRADSPLEIPSEKPPISDSVQSPVAKNKEEKIIERILVFYTDGTFREYSPSS